MLGAILGGVGGGLAGGFLGAPAGEFGGVLLGAATGEVVGVALGAHLGNGQHGNVLITLGISAGVALAGAGIGSLSDSEPWVRSVIVGTLAAQFIGVIQAQVLNSPTIQVRPEVEPGAGRWGLQVEVRR